MTDGEVTARRIFRAVAWPLAVALLVAVAQVSAWAGSEVVFPRPADVEPNVQFWVRVFTQYSYRDFVVHDRDDVSRVYQVMHLPGEGVPSGADVAWTNAYLKAKYGDILNRLASGAQPTSFEERQVAALFHHASPSTYAQAAQNLRVQQGLRERFREGLLRSRYYRPTMERIFRDAGLPVELVTLAEVESGFYPGARSSAGAVGIWQFTRSTGKQYMRINSRYDERLNPVRETEAAAQLLRYNYDVLGDWPLAITAYNYGTAGMARAAERYDNNYSRIFKDFDGPHFGFASKNYYSEFLAAVQIYRHEDQYFPGIQYESVNPPRQPSAVLHHARSLHHSRSRRYARRHHAFHRHRARACTGRCTVSKHSSRLAER
jgi:membrane-bound lytic murein transglycosylase D